MTVMHTVDQIADLVKAGEEALDLARRRSTERLAESEGIENADHLRPRTYTATELANFVGVVPSSITSALERFPELPQGQRRGNKLLFTLEDVETFRRVMFEQTGSLPYWPRRRGSLGEKCQVIAVCNYKGGSAKTTTSVLLASHLATYGGLRVLLIDLDPQASATALLRVFPDDSEIEPNHSIAGYFREQRDASELVRETYFRGVDIVPASHELQELEFELVAALAGEKGFRFWPILDRFIKEVREPYDVIIVDCKPDLGFLPINALFAASALITPLQPTMVDLRSTISFLGTVERTTRALNRVVGKDAFDFDFFRMLLSRADANSPSELGIMDAVKAVFGRDAVYDIPVMKTELVSSSFADQSLPHASLTDRVSPTTYRRGMKSITAAMRQVERDIWTAWQRKWPEGREEA